MMRSLVASVALFGLMGAAPAPPSGQDELARCVYPGQIERVGNDVGPTSRYFQASRGRVFRVDTTEDCFEPSSRGMGIMPYVSTSERMCSGDELRVTTSVSDLPRTCVARLSERVTDAAEIRSSGLGLSGRSSN